MDSSRLRSCARVGCGQTVKKPTNRYCSRACCALDPARVERLRHAHRPAQTARRPTLIPLARQLELPVWDVEEIFLVGQQAREEMPAGLSRLAV